MPVVCVDPTAYADAGALMSTVADQLAQALTTLAGDLAGSGGMAGSDSAGTTWAVGYDRGAHAALAGARSAVGAAGNVALRLHATGQNHAHADGTSTSGGGDSSFPAAPDTPTAPNVSVPSAAGGSSGGEPTGWSLISGLIGHVWPNGHQDRLRAAQGAADFLSCARQEGLPMKVDEFGSIRVYDPATNSFGSYLPDGTPRTFFKPTSPNYWDSQKGVLQ